MLYFGHDSVEFAVTVVNFFNKFFRHNRSLAYSEFFKIGKQHRNHIETFFRGAVPVALILPRFLPEEC